MNIGKIPAKTARLDPTREAVIDVHSERRITFGELDERIRRIANGLTGTLGLAKGHDYSHPIPRRCLVCHWGPNSAGLVRSA